MFQVKHLVCDYYLQGEYMLGKFHPTNWHLPLAAHAGVHMIATFCICMLFIDARSAFELAFVDFFLHFAVDRLKVIASRNLDPKTSKQFWWYLGGDQFAHHITHYYIILVVLANIYHSGV